MANEGALAGVRILNLADESAAYGVKLLADLGADVIKVEPPGGDRQRRFGPFLDDRPDPERSLWFWYYHTNQRAIALDLEQSGDREPFLRLVEGADILIDTYPVGALDRLGLGYDQLAARNPRLIQTSVTPFGLDGPRAHWRSSDLIAWATGGVMGLCGEQGREPLRGWGGQALHFIGLYTAIGTLGALYHQRQTGQGQRVDLSMQEAIAPQSESASLGWIYAGFRAVRQGNGHILAVPFACFPCKDGWGMVAALSQGQWRALVGWMQEDGFGAGLDDPRFDVLFNRNLERHLINPVVRAWTPRYTVQELFEIGQSRALPIGIAATTDRVLLDDHLATRDYWVAVQHPAGSQPLPYAGAPYKFQRGGWAIRRPAPRLDEHGEAIRQQGWQSVPPADKIETPDGAVQRPPWPLTPPADGSQRPLAGVRVADFTWALAGPWATRMLADLGADVVKIEAREVGCMARTFPPFKDDVPGTNRSGFFHFAHRNKRSITLDLKKPAGRAIAERLVAGADLVVDNFSGGVMDRLGLGYERIRQINPSAIVVSMSGFGQTGPRRDYVSYHATLTALAGHTYLTAYADSEPMGYGHSFSDFMGGLHGAVAILAALEHRRRTGEGQYIDLGQFEASVAIMGPWLLDAAAHGRPQQPVGNRWVERRAGPHDAYPCAGDDRWIAMAVETDVQWAALCQVAGHPEWREDPRFQTPEGRYDHADALDPLLRDWTRTQDMNELAERLQAAGVPAGGVLIAEDLLGDPQLVAREFWASLEDPEVGQIQMDRGPWRFSRTPIAIDRRPPLLGEHTEEVLRDVLGYGDEEVVEFLINEVV